MAPQTPRGLDLVMQLNLAGPRRFLLQVEDELEAFVLQGVAAPPAVAKQEEREEELAAEGRRQLVFPPLHRSYEELLVLMAQRYCLVARALEERRGSSSQRRMAVVGAGASRGARGALPLLGCGEFLRAQRLPGPPPPEQPPDTPSAGSGLYRLRLRHWALLAAASAGDGGEGCEPPADEAGLRAAVDAALGRQESEAGGRDDGASDSDAGPRRGGGALKRGRGFDAGEEAMQTSRTRHCYHRFGPRAAGRLYLRDSFAKAPWPSVRLRKLPQPPVFWRPEWRVGPDDSDMAERGAKGGVLSWALEPTSLAEGEGFEVSLRSGPGPTPTEVEAQTAAAAAKSQGGANALETSAAEDVNPQRDEDDFVLTFRRGEGAWHLAAGRRGRKAGGAQKVVPDPPGRGKQRQMFWVACTECRADGKHYVVAGTVPGILTEHFFVAKVGRAEPLSHAGFSYLPHPREAAFGKPSGTEPPPVLIESITVYPHGLTGDLPFISLRYVEQRPIAKASDDEVLVRAPLPNVDGEAASELLLRRSPLPAAEAGAERFAGWCRAALRECGLPVPPDEEQERARRAEKRARLRTEPRPVLQNPSEAPSSWEPSAAGMPRLGPTEETLRHAPAAWAAAQAKAEAEDEDGGEAPHEVHAKQEVKEEAD